TGDGLDYKSVSFSPDGVAAMYLSQKGIMNLAASVRDDGRFTVDTSEVDDKGRAEQLKYVQAILNDPENPRHAEYAAKVYEIYKEFGLYLATLMAEMSDYYDSETPIDDIVLTGRCVETEAGTRALIDESARPILEKWYPEISGTEIHLASALAENNPTINAFAQALGAAYLGNQELLKRRRARESRYAGLKEKLCTEGVFDLKELSEEFGIPESELVRLIREWSENKELKNESNPWVGYLDVVDRNGVHTGKICSFGAFHSKRSP
ncbi:unnamed protein product, partial [marine sediment metagenome]